MNQLCHQAARRAHNMDTLAKLLFREIDATLRLCVPTKTIFFAFDGPAPVAKLLTQRRRRAKESSKHPTLIPREEKAVAAAAARAARAAGPALAAAAVLDANDSDAKVGADLHSGKRRKKRTTSPPPVPPVVAIDRVALTPGTELMDQLASAVEYYCYVRLQTNPRFSHLQIRISGPSVPGEGELKIFSFLNSHVAGSTNKVPAADSAVVVGSDADIVLQALACISLQNLFVFTRNSNHGDSDGSRQAGVVNWTARTNTIISVWEIARHIHRLFPDDSLAVRLDFITISIMNGNDYLKALRGCSMPRFWRRYLKLRRGSSTDPFARKPVPSAEVMSKLASTTSASAAARLADDYDEADDDVGLCREKPPFATETLINPATRTFNWPFLCALVSNFGAIVPEITAESIRESEIHAARSRELQAIDRRQEEQSVISPVGTDDVADATEEDDVGDEILYTGNEDGDVFDEDDDELATAYSSPDEVDEFDEYDDEDSAHIDNLVAISGSSSKYFDSSQWLRTLLFTLHMYMDAYCPDFYFGTFLFCTYARPLSHFPHHSETVPGPDA
jgi:hypothetical protein